MEAKKTVKKALDNRITRLFKQKEKGVLSIFCTAGFPGLNDLPEILQTLEQCGVDMVEIGIPFSDPVADGDTIQRSNKVALDNGMTLELLFDQLKDIRKTVSIPLLLMGYLNPVMQYGVERFCKQAQAIGIDGMIIPDLPVIEYTEFYKSVMDDCQLSNVLLVTPQTSEERIQYIDQQTDGFIYMVSSNSITGKSQGVSEEQLAYFERMNRLSLQNPKIIGFGISDAKSFETACQYANGAIIGSAFIRAIEGGKDLKESVKVFIEDVKEGKKPTDL